MAARDAGSGAQVIAGLVGGDREQPRLQAAGRVKCLARQVKLQEGVLYDVVRRSAAVGEAEYELVKLAVMAFDQLSKGRLVALEVARQKLFIRWRGHASTISFARQQVAAAARRRAAWYDLSYAVAKD
jgi:hypothetical protein